MTDNQRREFLKLVGVSLVGATGISILGCDSKSNTQIVTDVSVPGNDETVSSAPAQGDSSANQTIKRKDLVERLKKLAESEIPEDLMCGAECYEMAGPFPKEEKPCPECERTMKVGEMEEILRAYNVPLKRIQDQGLDAKLIFPEYCSTCGFGLEEKILLEIKYSDHPDPVLVEPERPSIIDLEIWVEYPTDLELMALFLQGKDRYHVEYGEEKALKDKVKQLEKLFGIAETSD